jgi:hypothetical protein
MEIARVCTKQKALNILEFVKKYLKILKFFLLQFMDAF